MLCGHKSIELGYQKKITDKIAEKCADYVISLKGNQKTVHDEVKEVFDHTL